MFYNAIKEKSYLVQSRVKANQTIVPEIARSQQ
jgi:hypothetical protein